MSDTVQADGADGSPLPALISTLAGLRTDCDDALRVDQIRQLEELKSAVAAAQARVTAAFVASQREANRAAGVKPEHAERGIAHQVALAKRTSPFHARRYVGWATILTAELPATFARLQAGETSEWRAMIVARETGWLSRDHRAVVDAELAPQLESLGDRKTENQAKKIAYRLDPHGYTGRLGRAETERRVTLRPAPDVMARLSALVPVAQGIAAHTALAKAADALIGTGDSRSRGQLMADLLVQRLTGQASAGAVPVEVQVLIDADTLLGEGTEPAQITGHGPVPAPWARDLLLERGGPRWIRRLFTRPGTSELIAMDSRKRLFTEGQRRFITARDQVCRTPWCEAPIRHTDHIVPAEDGGPTSTGNGDGRCVACNLGKQTPGWREKPGHDGEFTITTQTGHRYRSRAPDLITPARSPLEIQVESWLHHHAA
jgi:hypothetical protein